MARLPVVNGDEDNWGSIIREFLQVEHDTDGTLKRLNQANGICPLDSNGLVPSENSPTNIKDVDGDTTFETERNTDEDIIRAKAGGQDVFEGYSSGIFSLVKQSALFIKKANTQTIPDTTITKIEFDTVVVDDQNEWDDTNYRFTATKDGVYLITASTSTVSVAWSAGDVAFFYLYKNDNMYVRLCHYTAEASMTRRLKMEGAVTIKLSAGDYLDIRIWISRGASTDILNESTYNYFTVNKIA